ncbi:dihydrolipoyl dehydrogenase family protein [Fulvivirga sedimenti]|uniref:NAD(P)/FAD-dependent oxidoreductase n=1 Tax=Fulvivirga sedimenti TaxID=2879465 RepID=A0A9X1HNQ8_9BACT|nr:NAD(P)/FAD-dependent oxidoreductase [Fulvivirga sedimenti]MCA6073559.1 NAD(P)/FAD-dependent oxidoreductase [Fulvivirga sedimenti]
MEHFELVVIGAGPAGYAATMRAMDFKKRTLLIEKNKVGGAGVINGALSSKTWWEISREVRQFNGNLSRYSIQRPEINFKEIQSEVKKATQERQWLLQDHLELLRTSETYKDLLAFRTGSARLLSKHEVEITQDGVTEVVYADNIILATGSRPRILDDIEVDETVIMTSNGIENMDHFPESLVIVGAGVVGCEYATIFSGFGKTKVYLIEKGEHILPFEDNDVVNVIEKNLLKAGVIIHRGAKLVRLEKKDEWVEYELELVDGVREIHHVEKALISVGRVPNIDGLWNENLDIQFNGRGIDNDDSQTGEDNIFAVGDLTQDIALVNVGELEGRHAVEKIFGTPGQLIYENISTIMFLHPEVAGVGMNELRAQARGLNYRVVTLDYSVIPRAMAKRNTEGFIKLLVTDDSEMKVLGMRVVGIHASSAIQAVALLISMDRGIEELAECVHPHPSITEGIQECVRMLLGKSTLKPDAISSKLSCRRFVNGQYENFLFDNGY